jgi:hypothetical protein
MQAFPARARFGQAFGGIFFRVEPLGRVGFGRPYPVSYFAGCRRSLKPRRPANNRRS